VSPTLLKIKTMNLDQTPKTLTGDASDHLISTGMKALSDCLCQWRGTDVERMIIQLSPDKKLELSIALTMAASEVIFTPKAPKLTDKQREVFLQLGQNLSDEENCQALRISRAGYFSVIEQLRIIFEVKRKSDLIRLSMEESEVIFTPIAPRLNDKQREVFLQLGQNLSDEENCQALHIGRSCYFSVLEELRMIFEVKKKSELVRLSMADRRGS
jgi:DNA-binding CsgD family transcriptional regulator